MSQWGCLLSKWHSVCAGLGRWRELRGGGGGVAAGGVRVASWRSRCLERKCGHLPPPNERLYFSLVEGLHVIHFSRSSCHRCHPRQQGSPFWRWNSSKAAKPLIARAGMRQTTGACDWPAAVACALHMLQERKTALNLLVLSCNSVSSH